MTLFEFVCSLKFEILVLVGLIVFILIWCCGCIVPGFVQDFTEEVTVACGAALKAQNPKPYLKAMKSTAIAVSDKIGTTGKCINEENVLDRLGETKQEAIDYQPWYSGLLNALPLGGTELPIGALILFLLRNVLRKGLHSLSHVPKKGGKS